MLSTPLKPCIKCSSVEDNVKKTNGGLNKCPTPFEEDKAVDTTHVQVFDSLTDKKGKTPYPIEILKVVRNFCAIPEN